MYISNSRIQVPYRIVPASALRIQASYLQIKLLVIANHVHQLLIKL